MTDKSVYEESEWGKTESVQHYVDNAEGFILERRRLLAIMKSFYSRFIKQKLTSTPRVLDLGCGDGILSRELLNVDRRIDISLLDGSEEMLESAKKLIGAAVNAKYVKSTFQELIDGKNIDGEYDFVVSSLAIHHLTKDEKKQLFQRIYGILAVGGAFVNIDVITAEEELEAWYLELWEEWISEREKLNPPSKSQRGISRTYKENHDNLPDTLEYQLEALRSIGFNKVDSLYKYGIFTIYGGFK